MDQAEFEKLVERVIESSTKQPDRQKTLRAVARRLIAVIGILTLLVTVGGFFLDGFAFFTRTLPRATAVVAKRILLSDNFRSLLVTHVAKQLAYDKLCTIDHQVVDFDGDGERTDLIIEFRAPGESGCEDYSHDIVYTMLKE